MPESPDNETSNYPFIIINTKLPLYMNFSTKPSSLTFDSKKVYNETRTIGGYIYEHWGRAPITLTVTGYIIKAGYDDNGNAIYEDSLFSLDLFKLKQLFELDRKKIQSIFATGVNSAVSALNLGSLSDTFIVYKTNILAGFFTDFQFKEVANNPYVNEYTFKFIITDSAEDYLMDAITSDDLTATVAGIGLSASNFL